MIGQKLNKLAWLMGLALALQGCDEGEAEFAFETTAGDEVVVEEVERFEEDTAMTASNAGAEQVDSDGSEAELDGSDAELDGSDAELDGSDAEGAQGGSGLESADVAEVPVEEPEPRDEGAFAAQELTFSPLSDAEDVVAYVDVSRYMGRWYEIATTPSFQQASCYATQADYSFNEEMGWVDVLNACRVGSTMGNWQQIAGKAELVDTTTQAKLNVIFFGQAAPYWVVALDGREGDEPYDWAVVSVPGKQVIWLLSRTNTMAPEDRAEIEAHLVARGFPVDTLIDTPHAE